MCAACLGGSIPGMHRRPLALALTLLLCAVPSAHASLADDLLPGSTGVRLVKQGKRDLVMRFTWDRIRPLAGERARVHCGVVVERRGQFWVDREGGGDRRVTRRGRSVVLPGSARFDFCALGTRSDGGRTCTPLTAEERWCVRVLVARTDAGRAYLDQLARRLEIELLMASSIGWQTLDAADRQELFLGDFATTLVALAGPDDAPPAGKVGYWAGETSDVFAAVLASGHRLFLRRDGDVFSTNSTRVLLPGQIGKLTVF